MLGNSLGRSEDIPTRSLELVRTADLVVGEEDRGIRKLLKAAGIHREYLRYSEHQQKQSLDLITAALRQGQHVAYFSDQGMPGLADPGPQIIEVAHAVGASLEVIPGPCSISSTIAACRFDCSRFMFMGFLPRQTELREREIQKFLSMGVPLVILETPYRLKPMLESLQKCLNPKHRIHISFDISGPSEQHWESTVARLDQGLPDEKLNFVLIIDRKNVEP